MATAIYTGILSVTPVAYQVIILEPGIGQFREFEPSRVHTYSHEFVGTFSCAQIDLWKARERELATLDEKSTSSGIAEPYKNKKLKSRTGGEKGRHLPVTTACPEAGK